MTREEAAIIIGNIPIDGSDQCYSIPEYQEAKTMAIEALKAQSCEDTDYKTLRIKLENAEDVIRGLKADLADAREELRQRW